MFSMSEMSFVLWDSYRYVVGNVFAEGSSGMFLGGLSLPCITSVLDL
jgi:hypothetical protein